MYDKLTRWLVALSDAMQADTNVINPTANGFTTFRAAHQDWWENYWNAGILNIQAQLKDNAQWMLNNTESGDDTGTLQAIVSNPGDPRFCYVTKFVYPTA